MEEWRNLSGQNSGDSPGCFLYDVDWENYNKGEFDERNSSERSCDKWEFDQTDFISTIKSEFGLVCHRHYLTSLAQTLYFVGMVLGVFTFGVLADLYGRKTVMVPLLVGMAVTGVLTSQMPSYLTFVICRVLNAFLVIAIFESFFTYMLEFVGGTWNTVVGLGSMFVWVAGWLSLALLAFLLRDWRQLVLFSSLPSLLSITMYWVLPESPRWLLSVGRLEEAEEILRAGAEYNNIKLPADFKLRPVQSPEPGVRRRRTVLDLFRYRNMRTKTLILYYNWFVNSFAYYGLSLNMGTLTGGANIYLNFTISGLLEIPAYTAAIFILLHWGRRVPYFLSILLCGLSLLAILCIPQGFANNWPALVQICNNCRMSLLYNFAHQGPLSYWQDVRHLLLGRPLPLQRRALPHRSEDFGHRQRLLHWSVWRNGGSLGGDVGQTPPPSGPSHRVRLHRPPGLGPGSRPTRDLRHPAPLHYRGGGDTGAGRLQGQESESRLSVNVINAISF